MRIKFSFVVYMAMMLYGESTTFLLAITNQRVHEHMGIALLACTVGFIGTALAFGELGKSGR